MLSGTTLGIFLVLFLLLPNILKSFFLAETYHTIENAQKMFLLRNNLQWLLTEIPASEAQQDIQNARAVQHVLLTENGQLIPQWRIPSTLASQMVEAVSAQTETLQQHIANSDSGQIYYIARKVTWANRAYTLISYMWNTYQQELTRMLFYRLIAVMAILTAFSWLPAIWLSRYLSRPLVQLQRHVQRMAKRDWKEKIEVDRNDEIGHLSKHIEQMRVQLVKQDEIQKSLLHNISHELKTPVMVIHSFAQSILDGVYPNGDLKSSVQVIETEAERLDKRIRDLLYLTRLDYLSVKEQRRESIPLDEMIRDTVNRLRWKRAELKWCLNLNHVVISGDSAQLQVVFENLLDNQIRYAKQMVQITLNIVMEKKRMVEMVMTNDGPPIETEVLDQLFSPFHKGEKGDFGLGLSIVHRVLTLHEGNIRAYNETGKPVFVIQLPL